MPAGNFFQKLTGKVVSNFKTTEEIDKEITSALKLKKLSVKKFSTGGIVSNRGNIFPVVTDDIDTLLDKRLSINDKP